MKTETKKIVTTALLAALICIATMMIKIPSPLKGYLNLGDGFVLVAGWILSPFYGLLAAGIGSALADIFAGYTVYAGATFLIKGGMALACHFIFQSLSKHLSALWSRILSGVIAEIIMVGGYYLFEGFLYGFEVSLVNILPNAMQGFAGILVGVLLIKALEKSLPTFE